MLKVADAEFIPITTYDDNPNKKLTRNTNENLIHSCHLQDRSHCVVNLAKTNAVRFGCLCQFIYILLLSYIKFVMMSFIQFIFISIVGMRQMSSIGVSFGSLPGCFPFPFMIFYTNKDIIYRNKMSKDIIYRNKTSKDIIYRNNMSTKRQGISSILKLNCANLQDLD